MTIDQAMSFWQKGVIEPTVLHYELTTSNQWVRIGFGAPPPEKDLCIYVDNSDLGWVKTDWDGRNDYCYLKVLYVYRTNTY